MQAYLANSFGKLTSSSASTVWIMFANKGVILLPLISLGFLLHRHQSGNPESVHVRCSRLIFNYRMIVTWMCCLVINSFTLCPLCKSSQYIFYVSDENVHTATQTRDFLFHAAGAAGRFWCWNVFRTMFYTSVFCCSLVILKFSDPPPPHLDICIAFS